MGTAVKVLSFILVVFFVLLQIRLWRGDGSLAQVNALEQEVAVQELKVKGLQERNQTLEAEVQDLKHRLGALEERARTDLGMIRKGETFYQYSAKGE